MANSGNRGTSAGKIPVAYTALVILVVLGLLAAATAGVKASRSQPGATAPEPDVPLVNAPLDPTVRDAAAPIPARLQALIRAAVSNPDVGNLRGIISDPLTGTELWSEDPGEAALPASTIKLLTAAAALTALGPRARVRTRVLEGERAGQVTLVGGGDPTLSLDGSAESIFHDSGWLADLAKQLQVGGVAVTSIVIDTALYSGPATGKGWGEFDVQDGFAAPIEPLMVEAGRANPAADYSPRTQTPAKDAGTALAGLLGLPASAVSLGTAAPEARELAAVESAPLDTRLRDMFDASDNVLAEAVGREVALATGRPASFEGAAAAVTEVLGAAGVDLSAATLADLSGLSVDDRVPPAAIELVLRRAAADAPEWAPLLDYLPIAAGTGTLADRFAAAGDPAAAWVRAKTGTLNEATGLAGTVMTLDGRVLTFALLSNGSAPDKARPAVDRIVSLVRQCGCS